MLIFKIIYFFEHVLYAGQENWTTGHLLSKKLPSILTYNTVKLVDKCTMPMMWIGKCVRVVLVVNIMIHS